MTNHRLEVSLGSANAVLHNHHVWLDKEVGLTLFGPHLVLVTNFLIMLSKVDPLDLVISNQACDLSIFHDRDTFCSQHFVYLVSDL